MKEVISSYQIFNMESCMKVKVTAKKMGAELKKCNRKIKVLEKGIDEAVKSLCKLGERIKEIKEELQNIQRMKAVLENDYHSSVQRNHMQRSKELRILLRVLIQHKNLPPSNNNDLLRSDNDDKILHL